MKRRQTGAVILTVALTMLFLLGFMGIALDFGHLFVVKTELQTATDSCALAAAQELDGASDALTRATSAGRTAGNLNKTNFQGGTAGLAAADITFSDSLIGAYSSTFAPVANARYARCVRTRGGMAPWMLQAMSAFSGNAAYGANRAVFAQAVATRASAQSTCPLPISIKPKAGGVAPNYGFQVGEWVVLLSKDNVTPGKIGWFPLNSGGKMEDIENQLNGTYCGVKANDNVGTEVSGVKASLFEIWNYRFGIYKNKADPSVDRPDYSGYAYTTDNWKPRAGGAMPNAYSGSTPPGSHATAANFKTKRLAFASYDDTGTDIKHGDKITGLKMNSFKELATPNPGGQHDQLGYNRRIVLVPVTPFGSTKVVDFVCMLMLRPIEDPNADVELEFLGNAGAVNSPCTTYGMAGGTAGPLVPTLVQ